MPDHNDVTRDAVLGQLRATGWDASDIISEQLVPSGRTVLRPDFVLLYRLNRIAVVEVNRPTSSFDAGFEQVRQYMDAIEAPFGYVTDGTRVFEVERLSTEFREVPSFPAPEALWARIELVQHEKLLRAFPEYTFHHPPRVSQAAAVEAILQGISHGQKRMLIHMAPGSGVSFVQFQAAWKLFGSATVRGMLFVTPSRSSLHQTARRFSPLSSSMRIYSGDMLPVEPPFTEEIQFWSTRYLLEPAESPRYRDIPPSAIDLIFLGSIAGASREKMFEFISYFSSATVVAFTDNATTSSTWQKEFGAPAFEYTIEQSLAISELSPPEGFEAVRLEALAKVEMGVHLRKQVDPLEEGDVRVITARDIDAEGVLDAEPHRTIRLGMAAVGASDINAARSSERFLQPGDLLMTCIAPFRITVLPESITMLMIHAASVVRIRPLDPRRGAYIYDFLRSDAGTGALRQLASGTVVQRITLQALAQLRVLIPIDAPQHPDEAHPGISNELQPHATTEVPNFLEQAQPPQFSAASNAARVLSEEVLPALQQEDCSTEAPEPAPSFPDIAAKLRSIADTLAPPLLGTRVMESYPMPIALAYRRFHEARFNPFEQVLRLRDLAEAISFFVYNVLLADLIRNLQPALYRVEDRGARRAYKGYSMAARLDFVEAVIGIATTNGGNDLFVPDFVRVPHFVATAREVQDDLRNRISHTAASSESQQTALLKEFQPKVEEMLTDLGFLPAYPLARVTGFFYKGGQLIRRLEVYNGVARRIDEHALPDDSLPTRAERDHLVLLNSDDQVLDLYPLYQLLSSAETRHESHLCVFKQRKKDQGRMEGESVLGAFPLNLEGFDEFEVLEQRISD